MRTLTQYAFALGTLFLSTAGLPAAQPKFEPTLESLKQYRCPDWFRDAKFGIWSHWGPQAVPMDGDWYARGMYEQGSKHYKYHLAHYGHPSTNGYKDIIPLWKAEKWDPNRLMALYKEAGAKYFVSMGCHHDNFDLWNSRHHQWNAVNYGPHRDVVGDWQKAARKQGLKFGVSEHLGASFTWFQVSHGSDKTGPLAGVPYDGANPQWQDLYHWPALTNDKSWYSNDPRWHRRWSERIADLLDSYHPDLLYTDGGVPFGNETGRAMIAHLYNTGQMKRGAPQTVYTCKQKSEGRWIEDLERGVMPGINPHPWQTDTSIGDWYYNRDWKFRPVSWVIHMLADIVSKNGNLLLNVVQKPDGSLDPEVEQMLGEMAEWNKLNAEAIFGTRPWLIYGEGAIRAKGGSFKEDFAYGPKDIRFTTKGNTLYAIALGVPQDRQIVIRSLGRPASDTRNQVRRVELLGHRGKLAFNQTAEGLTVQIPEKHPSKYTTALRIAGGNWDPMEVQPVVEVIKADAQGAFRLEADRAEIHGEKLGTEQRGGQINLGFWDNASEWASWKVRVPKAGNYTVQASIAAGAGATRVGITAGGQALQAAVAAGNGWESFREVDLGILALKDGEVTIAAKPLDAASWRAINLRWLRLVPQ